MKRATFLTCISALGFGTVVGAVAFPPGTSKPCVQVLTQMQTCTPCTPEICGCHVQTADRCYCPSASIVCNSVPTVSMQSQFLASCSQIPCKVTTLGCSSSPAGTCNDGQNCTGNCATTGDTINSGVLTLCVQTTDPC